MATLLEGAQALGKILQEHAQRWENIKDSALKDELTVDKLTSATIGWWFQLADDFYKLAEVWTPSARGGATPIINLVADASQEAVESASTSLGEGVGAAVTNLQSTKTETNVIPNEDSVADKTKNAYVGITIAAGTVRVRLSNVKTIAQDEPFVGLVYTTGPRTRAIASVFFIRLSR